MISILGLLIVCIITGAMVVSMWEDSDTCTRCVLIGLYAILIITAILVISLMLGIDSGIIVVM